MSITILGQHISLIRPERINKPIVSKSPKRRASKPKTIEHSLQDLIRIAQEMGYSWKGNVDDKSG